MISEARKIPGWMSDAELTWLAKHAKSHYIIAEIGSWRGLSTRALADNALGRVFAIDMWWDTMFGFEGDKWWQNEQELWRREGWLFREFLRNLAPHIGRKVAPFRLESGDAANLFRDIFAFDMIFIDADHEYESVKADIEAWQTLLAPGGLLCGHDYCLNRAGVIRAVGELVPTFKVIDTIWYA
jgi:hypothetical protein